ncbi:hypothetical protein M5689_024772 [Euphorbia peplus]|nr:hypothetical protein M5689_024772 [Euphorbia peplus]
MRIRVSVDAIKRLRDKMTIGKEGGDKCWINFKYERLPQFCFYCACIGHADRFFPTLLDHPNLAQAVRPYSASLRAPTSRQVAPLRSKYLLPSPLVVVPSAGPVSNKSTSSGDGSSSSTVAAQISMFESENQKKDVVDGILVNDSKRRKATETTSQSTGHVENASMDCDPTNNDTGSKNAQKAGAAT